MDRCAGLPRDGLLNESTGLSRDGRVPPCPIAVAHLALGVYLGVDGLDLSCLCLKVLSYFALNYFRTSGVLHPLDTIVGLARMFIQ